MYQIGQFKFDPLKRSLVSTHGSRQVRPKTATLLSYFLEQPRQVLCKDQLIKHVWGHEHVDDQTLFQLISNIRSMFADRHCLLTHPGRGYEWVWPVKRDSNRRAASTTPWPIVSVAAGLCAIIASVFFYQPLSGSSVSPQVPLNAIAHQFSLTPMIHHVQTGISARAQGDEAKALLAFQKALAIEPENVALLLELSQSQLILGQQSTALQTATDALSAARANHNLANEVIASLYMSHIQYQTGDMDAALNHSSLAQQLAQQHDLLCGIELSERWDQQLQLVLHTDDVLDRYQLMHPLQLAACDIMARDTT